jgi:aspartate aminotransferase
MFRLNPRFDRVKQSATDVIGGKAFALKQQGKSLIDFGVGEPFFETPDHVKSAAKDAIEGNITRYTPVAGLPVLKEAIIRKLQLDNSLGYQMDEIVVGSGAKQIIFNAFAATLLPGDKVIILAPHWVSYPDKVALTDGVPIILQTSSDSGYAVSPQALRNVLTDKSRWLVLNSPGNPTGKVYSKQELVSIAEVLRDFPEVLILADDIYEKVVFDEREFYTLAQVAPDLKDRILVVNGMSASGRWPTYS